MSVDSELFRGLHEVLTGTEYESYVSGDGSLRFPKICVLCNLTRRSVKKPMIRSTIFLMMIGKVASNSPTVQ